ncbi:MAG: flippase-like domain-containing protein, partial [Clostridia bacterium]|nr:flippase-like domain-containing protein [Clostridia bacterium]
MSKKPSRRERRQTREQTERKKQLLNRQNIFAPTEKAIQDIKEATDAFSEQEIAQPKKNKKKKSLSTILLMAVIAIGIYMTFEMARQMTSEQKDLGQVLTEIVPVLFVIFILSVICIFLLDSLKYLIIMYSTTGKLYPLAALKVCLLGRYYDNITPFATGGQPMQIYYLYKKGFSGGLSGAVVGIKYT